VTVALPSDGLATIQPAELGLLSLRLEDGGAETKTHGSTHVGLGDLGHETDDRVGSGTGELSGVGVGKTANVAGPLDNGDLETETDTEEGDLLLTGPLDSGNHTLSATDTETAGDDDALGRADSAPSVVVANGVVGLHLGLEVTRVDPLKLELATTAHRGVLEGLDDRHVRVLEGGVLADKDNGDRVKEALRANAHLLPALHEGVTLLLELGADADTAHVEALLEELNETLLAEEERNVIGRLDIVDTKNLLGGNVAEHGNLLHGRGKKGVLATAGDLRSGLIGNAVTHEVRNKTKTAEITDTSLGRLGLLLAADNGDERDVDEGKVVVADAELELAHGLDEGSRLDVTNGTTKLKILAQEH